MKYDLHHSERRGFKRCRKKWQYQYHDALVPKNPNVKLWLGTGIHIALSAYYSQSRTHDVLISAFMGYADTLSSAIASQGLVVSNTDDFNEAIELGKGMLSNYYEFARQNDNFEVVHTEQELSVALPAIKGASHVTFTFRPDGIVRDAEGGLWLLEHKTATSLDISHLLLDEQVSAYLWGAQEHYGMELKGVYYNILKKSVPREPELLQNGKALSKAKILTTYAHYLNAIKRYGLNEAEYAEKLNDLKAEGYNLFFRREKIYRNQEHIRNAAKQLYAESLDIRAAKRNPEMYCYRNATMDCSWDCGYRELCLSELDGSDAQFLRDTLYKTKEKQDDNKIIAENATS